MVDTATIMWNYLIALDLKNFFIYALNIYFPFGMFFWMAGLVLFGIVQLKTKNTLYSMMVITIWFNLIANSGLIINAFSQMAMRYVGLGMVLVLGYYLYVEIKGGRS